MSECIFCKIAAHEIPGTIVYEDEEVIAFEDLHPLHPVHILVIPKRHIASLADASDEDTLLLGKLLQTVRKLAEEKGIVKDGYRVVTNCGVNGGQAVMHLHLHLLGGEKMNTVGA